MTAVFPDDVRERFFLAVAFCRPLGEVVVGILRCVRKADFLLFGEVDGEGGSGSGSGMDGDGGVGMGMGMGEGVLLESVRRKLIERHDQGKRANGEGAAGIVV
jgi:hypothetical protein